MARSTILSIPCFPGSNPCLCQACFRSLSFCMARATARKIAPTSSSMTRAKRDSSSSRSPRSDPVFGSVVGISRPITSTMRLDLLLHRRYRVVLLHRARTATSSNVKASNPRSTSRPRAIKMISLSRSGLSRDLKSPGGAFLLTFCGNFNLFNDDSSGRCAQFHRAYYRAETKGVGRKAGDKIRENLNSHQRVARHEAGHDTGESLDGSKEAFQIDIGQ